MLSSLAPLTHLRSLQLKITLNSGSNRYALILEDDKYCVYNFIENTSGCWSSTIYDALTMLDIILWNSIYQWRNDPYIICYFDSIEQFISDYQELFI